MPTSYVIQKKRKEPPTSSIERPVKQMKSEPPSEFLTEEPVPLSGVPRPSEHLTGKTYKNSLKAYKDYIKYIKSVSRPQEIKEYRLYRDFLPLKKECEKFGVRCFCEGCCPDIYTAFHPHRRINFADINPMTGAPRLRESFDYEGLYLARASIAFFTRPMEEFGNQQSLAVRRFRDLYEEHGSAFEAEDASKTVSNEVLEELYKVITDVFFFGVSDRMKSVQWSTDMPEGCGVAEFIQGSPDSDWCITIKLHPTAVNLVIGEKCTISDVRTCGRISTLLHEAIHAYFYYACSSKNCPTFHHSVGDGGHGRAFLLLSHAVEQFTQNVLSASNIDLNRQTAYLDHSVEYKTLPSLCDLSTPAISGIWDNGEPPHHSYFDVVDGVINWEAQKCSCGDEHCREAWRREQI